MSRSCIHFLGAMSRCKAKIDVESMRDDDLRLPCHEVNGITGEAVCDEREWPQQVSLISGPMAKAFEHIAHGRCPRCSAPIEREQSAGGSVYALPCRHIIRKETAG